VVAVVAAVVALAFDTTDLVRLASDASGAGLSDQF
jgi:hypothetical protein